MNTLHCLRSYRSLALTAALIALSACDSADKGDKPSLPESGKIAVASAIAASPSEAASATASSAATQQAGHRFVGNLEARERIDVAPKMTGVLTDVLVAEGDVVEKGQPLFRQQDTLARLSVNQAEAAVALARAQLELATKEFKRATTLAEKGTTAQARLDLAEHAAKAAKAGLAQAEAAHALARFQVTEASVRAPLAGTITHKLLDAGELATMMPPSVVVVLQDLTVLKARIKVPVQALEGVKVGQSLTIFLRELGLEKTGTVSRIADTIDPMTRTGELLVEIANDDGALKPGMYIEGALLLPTTAAAPTATEAAKEPAKQAEELK